MPAKTSESTLVSSYDAVGELGYVTPGTYKVRVVRTDLGKSKGMQGKKADAPRREPKDQFEDLVTVRVKVLDEPDVFPIYDYLTLQDPLKTVEANEARVRGVKAFTGAFGVTVGDDDAFREHIIKDTFVGREISVDIGYDEGDAQYGPKNTIRSWVVHEA